LRGHLTWACLRVSTMCFRECVVLFCCQQTIFVSILLYKYSLFILLLLCLWLCLRLGFLCYSCGSGVGWPAVLCFAAGRACVESTFPVLYSGVLRADCCADSNCCEVSYPSYFLLLCMIFLRFLVSRILAAVGCCCFLVYSLVLRSVLISAISILWWLYSVLKCLKLMFIFAEQCEVLCDFRF